MNWTQLLANGPGESPGRAEAIAQAQSRTAERYAAQGGPKRARGSSKAKVTKVPRSVTRSKV
jgi:hypothetical protein